MNRNLEYDRLDCKWDSSRPATTAAAAPASAAVTADSSSAIVDLGLAEMSVWILARMTAFAGSPDDSAIEPADSTDSVAGAVTEPVAEAGPATGPTVAAAEPAVASTGPVVAAAGPAVAATGPTGPAVAAAGPAVAATGPVVDAAGLVDSMRHRLIHAM